MQKVKFYKKGEIGPVELSWWGALRTSYIYTFLSICLFVFNKRQKGWTDWAQLFFLRGTLYDPRKDLRILRITKSCVQNLLSFVKFWPSKTNVNTQIYFVFSKRERKCCIFYGNSDAPMEGLGLKIRECFKMTSFLSNS